MAEPRALAAVIGHPVSHSISPLIFGYLSKKTGVAVTYLRFPIPPARLRATFEAMEGSGLFVGWNVTIPHKEPVARLAKRLSPEVKLLGAANVLRFGRSGAEAFNTDVFGVSQTLREHGIPVRGRVAVVFGAGGAALAAGFALGILGASEVRFVNRTPARAARAAARLGRKFRGTRFGAAKSAGEGPIALYINATPLGMKGFPRKSVLPQAAARGAWAFDLIYRPERTVFLESARARGLKTVGGLDMLIWQALATWELWFGPFAKGPGLERLHRGLRTHLRKNL